MGGEGVQQVHARRDLHLLHMLIVAVFAVNRPGTEPCFSAILMVSNMVRLRMPRRLFFELTGRKAVRARHR